MNHPTLTKYNGEIELDGKVHRIQTIEEAFEKMMEHKPKEMSVNEPFERVKFLLGDAFIGKEAPSWYAEN